MLNFDPPTDAQLAARRDAEIRRLYDQDPILFRQIHAQIEYSLTPEGRARAREEAIEIGRRINAAMPAKATQSGPIPSADSRVFAILDGMSQVEREGLFGLMRGRYCLECGADNPLCPCRRDE